MPDTHEGSSVLLRVLETIAEVRSDLSRALTLLEGQKNHGERITALELAEAGRKAVNNASLRRVGGLAGFSGAIAALLIELFAYLVPLHR